MSSDCLRITPGNPWLDTVDQEHIPVRISNSCEEEVSVELEALTPQGSVLQRVSLKLPGSVSKEVEFVTDLYLQRIVIRGRWRRSGNEWQKIEELVVALR